jgi:hypothetical protein
MIYMPDFMRSVCWIDGEPDLVIRTFERDPATSQWSTQDWPYSVSFAIKNISPRDGQDFAVHGIATNGDDVVELWTFVPVVGSYTATRPRASTAIGQPYGGSGTTSSIVGGTYVAPSQRPANPRITRRELYRGTTLGGVRAMAIDPDCRFVLLLAAGNSGLYRLDIPNSGAAPPPVLVLAATELPQLGTGTLLSPLQHTSEGRIYVLESVGGAPLLVDETSVLYDVNNDGLFDGHLTMTHANFDQTYGPEELFVDDFYDYDD